MRSLATQPRRVLPRAPYSGLSTRKKTILAIVLVAAAGIALALLLIPGRAYADSIIDKIINGIFQPWLATMCAATYNTIACINSATIFSGTWESLIASNYLGISILDMANTICDTIVKPIAYAILALVMLARIVTIAGRADENATIPLLRDVFFLIVFYVVLRFLIAHSNQLCAAIFTDFDKITAAIMSYGFDSGTMMDAYPLNSANETGAGGTLMALVLAAITWLAASIAMVVSYVVAYVRVIQLYIYSAFAPIPISLLGFEHTRSFGIGFLRNFAALCISGAVMVFALWCFPLLVGAVNVGNGLGDFTASCFGCIVCTVGLIVVLVKSGSIAKGILGE